MNAKEQLEDLIKARDQVTDEIRCGYDGPWPTGPSYSGQSNASAWRVTMTQPPLTPAMEAMEDYKATRYPDNKGHYSWVQVGNIETKTDDQILTALALLDRVQNGTAKVLGREPTELMMKIGGHVTDAPRAAWRAFWDAAPLPQDDGEK